MRNPSLNKMMLSIFRARMICLWLAGMSAREISCCTGASMSTVYRWVRRWQAGDSVEAKHSRGRQPERIVNEYLSLETRGYLQGLAAAAVSCEIYEHGSYQAEIPCTALFGCTLPLFTCSTSPFSPFISKQMQTKPTMEF